MGSLRWDRSDGDRLRTLPDFLRGVLQGTGSIRVRWRQAQVGGLGWLGTGSRYPHGSMGTGSRDRLVSARVDGDGSMGFDGDRPRKLPGSHPVCPSRDRLLGFKGDPPLDADQERRAAPKVNAPGVDSPYGLPWPQDAAPRAWPSASCFAQPTDRMQASITSWVCNAIRGQSEFKVPLRTCPTNARNIRTSCASRCR